MLLDKLKLESDEQVLKQTRRHPFIIITQVGFMVMVGLAPLVLVGLGSAITPVDPVIISFESLEGFLLFMYCVFLSTIWIAIFGIITNYYLDLLIITDRRIILINHKGFFWRNMASFRLERMQDINIEINGIIATMLNFGTIEIETAGHGEEDFRAVGIADPSDIKAIIIEASDTRMQKVLAHEVARGV